MVKMKHRGISLEDLFASLDQGHDGDHTLVGFVRRTDDDDSAIHFAPVESPESWRTLPSQMLTGYDILSRANSRGDEQHLVRLYLRAGSEEEHDDVAALVERHGPRVMSEKHRFSGAPARAQFCYFDEKWNRYVCVPVH